MVFKGIPNPKYTVSMRTTKMLELNPNSIVNNLSKGLTGELRNLFRNVLIQYPKCLAAVTGVHLIQLEFSSNEKAATCLSVYVTQYCLAIFCIILIIIRPLQVSYSQST